MGIATLLRGLAALACTMALAESAVRPLAFAPLRAAFPPLLAPSRAAICGASTLRPTTRRTSAPLGLLRACDASDAGGPALITLSLRCLTPGTEDGQTVSGAEVGIDVAVLSDLLMETGALSVVVEDADRGTDREMPVFNEPDSAQAFTGGVATSDNYWRHSTVTMDRTFTGGVATSDNYWWHSTVTAYYTGGWDVKSVVDMVAETFEMPLLPRFSVDQIPDRDWVKKVQEGWPPLMVGDLLLRFPWHTAEDVAAVLPDGSENCPSLMLEGGMAFGTGEHPTTRLCCNWLQRQVREGGAGMRVLDYGAGSGVLGLAAIKFGAKEAIGVEIDRDAIAASLSNARLNSLDTLFRCYLPSDRTNDQDERYAALIRSETGGDPAASECAPLPDKERDFDAVVANILAGPLQRLASEIASLARAGAPLGLSGVLATQAPEVVAAYTPYFNDVIVEEQDGDWVLITGVRKAS